MSMENPASQAFGLESGLAALDSIGLLDERTLSEALNRADEQTKRLNIAVNAGVMEWLRKKGVDPETPLDRWPE